MNLDTQTIWTIVIALAVIVIIGLIAAGVRRSRTQRLREHFGSEYDHAVESSGSRSRAEDALVARAEEVKSFDIRPLTAAERQQYVSDWQTIEKRFVDRPATAVVEADELITDVMRTRGYPMADFEKHAEYLSVKHPRVVEHYRAGHDIIDRHGRSAASTEDLRQAVLHYRALFEELVNEGHDVVREVPTSREVAASRRADDRVVPPEERPHS